MCHAKLESDATTVESWQAMLRLHKTFVDSKWPGTMSSNGDYAGGQSLMYFEKVVAPFITGTGNALKEAKVLPGSPAPAGGKK